MSERAVVVAHSVGTVLGEVVVGVTVLCPYGCRQGKHRHAWTRPTGTSGGERVAHCDAGGRYRLHWPGGVPAEVAEALEARYARTA